MLVSAKEMLEKAVEGHYAVGQFNINNLEWTRSALLAAEEVKSPIILGVSEGAGKWDDRIQDSFRYGTGHDRRTEYHSPGSITS